MLAEAEITALVLCGGAGTRMDGVDKPLQPIEKAGLTLPMVDHVIAALPQHSRLLISANRNIQTYQQRGFVISDEEQLGSGPLLGVLGGLESADTPWLLICPGDMPFLAEDWHNDIRQIAQNASTKGTSTNAFVVHDGTRLQPLLCLVHSSCKENLRAYLQTGEYSVHRWLSSIGSETVNYTNSEAFLNINTSADLLARNHRADPANSNR